jgi:hypothetical protein
MIWRSSPFARKNRIPPSITIVAAAEISGSNRIKPLVTPRINIMGSRPKEMLLICSRFEYSQADR